MEFVEFIEYKHRKEAELKIGLIYASQDTEALYPLVREYDPITKTLADTFLIVTGEQHDTKVLDAYEDLGLEEADLDKLDLSFTPETITAEELSSLFSGTVAWWDGTEMTDDTIALSQHLESKLLKAFLCFNNPAALAAYMGYGLPNNDSFTMKPYAQRRNIIKTVG